MGDPLHLYPYHSMDLEEMVRHLLQIRPTEVLVAYCTGAGKTVLSKALATRLLMTLARVPGSCFTHIVMAAPTEVTRDGFETGDYDRVVDSTGTYPICPIRGDDEVTLLEYLSNPNPGYALRLTHTALRVTDGKNIQKLIKTLGPTLRRGRRRVTDGKNIQKLIEENPRFGEGKLWILDEAAHARLGNLLGAVRDRLLAAGSSIVYLTATPPDDIKRRCEDSLTVYRTLPDQMIEGRYAPEQLVNELLMVSGSYIQETTDARAVPVDPLPIAEAILDHIEHDDLEVHGHLKALVRVKNTSKVSTNRAMIMALASALSRSGRRVFIASDVHVQAEDGLQRLNNQVLNQIRSRVERQGRENDFPQSGNLSEVRRYEHLIAKNFEDSCVDVIIGMDNIIEGFDWPFLSHAYLIGIPRKIDTIVQILGRIMRLRQGRINHYPAAWVNRSKMVMLVPEEACGSFEQAQAEQMLAICAYLSTFHMWSPLAAAFRTLRALKIRDLTPEEEECLIREWRDLQVPHELQTLIGQAHAEALRLWERAGVESQAHMLCLKEHVKMTDVLLNQEHFRTGAERRIPVEVIKEVIAQVHRSTEEDFSRRLEEELRNTPEQSVGSAIRRAMASLINELDEVRPSNAADSFMRTAGTLILTGQTILSFGHSVHDLFSSSPNQATRTAGLSPLGQHLRRRAS